MKDIFAPQVYAIARRVLTNLQVRDGNFEKICSGYFSTANEKKSDIVKRIKETAERVYPGHQIVVDAN